MTEGRRGRSVLATDHRGALSLQTRRATTPEPRAVRMDRREQRSCLSSTTPPRAHLARRRRSTDRLLGRVVVHVDDDARASVKAVVLECARACRARRRVCRVVSFSNEDGVEVLDLDPNYRDGDNDDDDYLTRLLDFLSKSFEGGGTDVTGALKRQPGGDMVSDWRKHDRTTWGGHGLGLENA